MRPAAVAGAASTNDDPVAHDEGADAWVRRSASQAAAAQSQRRSHEASIGITPGRFASQRRLSAHTRLDADFGLARPDSSSGELASSSINMLKSRASLKLRYTEAKRT